MNASLEEFNALLDEYGQTLNEVSEEALLYKPDEERWSLGQMYNHLFNTAIMYHLRQVSICQHSADNADKDLNERGRIAYETNTLSTEKIKVPPSPRFTPTQPSGKEELREKMARLRNMMEEKAAELDVLETSGRTEHFVLGWLDAKQWYQMIPMHFRHHLRQRDELLREFEEQKAKVV